MLFKWKKNLELAFRYYKLAADQGNDSDAQYNLACCYEDGEGTEKNISEAIKYYSLSKNQGNDDAIKKLKKINQKYLEIQQIFIQNQSRTKEQIKNLIDIPF